MWSMRLAPILQIPDGIDVPEEARRQDGVFTRSQARAAGWGDRAQRRLIRQGLWVPVAGPVLRHHEVERGPWQLARAVHLTGGLVVSHATAGLLWQLAVPAALHGTGHVERRPSQVWVHRIPLAPRDVLKARGLTVTSPERTLRDLLCSLRGDVGVEMLTDAFQRGVLTARDVDTATLRAHGRYGVTMARRLADSCRREPHSVLEWRFHGLCEALGPGWRFNVDIYDEQGFVGRVDALHDATGTIIELDSRRFHGEDRFQLDRTRDQRLAALGHVVIRLTWDDVERRPMEIVERIRRTVAVRARAVRKPTATSPAANLQPSPRPAA
ncbi:MAG TPA: type IV toxin-antitoxin system AbiEi family antitoxin domain-containing protein [Motilibacterales bacterium]|nr:type IV toxin-antitoxin system AbiEi family antitoxin domain-containing protein [Motilibacterales bacterium]